MSGLKSRSNDQDTFGSLFTLCTVNATVHSGPHNAIKEIVTFIYHAKYI